MKKLVGYAVVPEGDEYDDSSVCYTSAPEMLGGGSVYQVYRTLEDAQAFCKVPFYDATYRIVEVEIRVMLDASPSPEKAQP